MRLLLAVPAAFLVAVAVAFARRLRAQRTAVPRAEERPAAARTATLLLDLDADPSNPAAQRLVSDAAARAFATMPDVRAVEVRGTSGTLLGRVEREPLVRPVTIPAQLHEPHVARHRPDPFAPSEEREPTPVPPPERWHGAGPPDPVRDESRRPLAEAFDLPESARACVRDAQDPADLVRAILEAGGRRARAEGGVVVSDDTAIVLAGSHLGDAVTHETLNRAFLRFRASGARHGIVVGLGFMDPLEVRRREMLEPALAHTGPEGIQRMADAVALGADPLRFALAAPVRVA